MTTLHPKLFINNIEKKIGFYQKITKIGSNYFIITPILL